MRTSYRVPVLVALLSVSASVACGPSPRIPIARSDEGVAIVAVEGINRATRLVWLDSDGRRKADLTPEDQGVVDFHPEVSPDGEWIAFASTRQRSRGGSLWIVQAAVGATPIRITRDSSADDEPAWTPDGRALIYQSMRSPGGHYDLWRVDIDFSGTQPRGLAPVQVTKTPDVEEIQPVVLVDGGLVFVRASDKGSAVWLRALDGRESRLTAGPNDVYPAVSPDGRRLAYAAPFRDDKGARVDTDVFLVELSRCTPSCIGKDNRTMATRLVNDPLADQQDLVWSRDGRYVFGTSVYRSVADQKPLFYTVTFVDLQEPVPRLRALRDPYGAGVRLQPALGMELLDPAQLAAHPDYKVAVRVQAKHIFDENRERERLRDRKDAKPTEPSRSP